MSDQVPKEPPHVNSIHGASHESTTDSFDRATLTASTMVPSVERTWHGDALDASPTLVIRFYGDDATTSRGANWCEDHSSRGRRRPGQNE